MALVVVLVVVVVFGDLCGNVDVVVVVVEVQL